MSSTPTPSTPLAQPAEQGESGRHQRPIWVSALNKHVTNPIFMALGGRAFSLDWAILHHVGRRSGRTYATPIVAHPIAGGFLIALPYGVHVDWLRNVQAAGRATIKHKGTTYSVGSPELLTEEDALPLLSRRMARTMHRYHIARYLRVHVRADGDVG